MDDPAAQFYKLSVHDLKNFDALDPNKAGVMKAHGITKADFQTMLALDPFANGPAPIDSGRYIRTTHSFPYERADSSSECNNGVCSCVVMSSTKIQNDLTTTSSSTKTSYSVGLKESDTFGAKDLLSATVTATQKFTWTTTSSKSNTNSSSKSATVTILCPSQAWKTEQDYTQIDVYWDTWYGSFMFAPTSVAEQAPGLHTFVQGHLADKAGKPLRHEPVSVTVDGKTYKTLTNSSGDYAVYGIGRGSALPQGQQPDATATVRNRSYKVQAGSTQPNSVAVE
jgi:hypothetical protein